MHFFFPLMFHYSHHEGMFFFPACRSLGSRIPGHKQNAAKRRVVKIQFRIININEMLVYSLNQNQTNTQKGYAEGGKVRRLMMKVMAWEALHS